MSFDPKMLHLLQHWITERERIRVLRTLPTPPPRPWTKDRVLDTYSFCNVRRMDDRISRWLMDKWYVKAARPEMLLVQATLGRLINWPQTLACIAPPVARWMHADELNVAGTLRRLEGMAGSTYGNAYLVVGTEFSVANGGKASTIPRIVTRVHHIAESVCAWETMEMAHSNLMDVRGLGSFLAGQIIADLRWLRGGHYMDPLRWAPIGPGSRRGMNRLLKRPLEKALPQVAFENTLLDLRTRLKLPPRVEAMDLQNCLCEFDKYCRATLDGHRPHRLYRGKAVMVE